MNAPAPPNRKSGTDDRAAARPHVHGNGRSIIGNTITRKGFTMKVTKEHYSTIKKCMEHTFSQIKVAAPEMARPADFVAYIEKEKLFVKSPELGAAFRLYNHGYKYAVSESGASLRRTSELFEGMRNVHDARYLDTHIHKAILKALAEMIKAGNCEA